MEHLFGELSPNAGFGQDAGRRSLTQALGGTEQFMPLSEVQKRSADLAEMNGYLPAYRSIAKEMCACFWWHGTDEHGNYRILQNGTVCFIHTGSQLVAVTAAHVLEGYLQAKERDPNIVCQLGNITYNPERHIIAIDRSIDLATFSVSSVVVAGAGSSPSTPLSWPPPSVAKGDVLLCGGHPGAIRKERYNCGPTISVVLGSCCI